MAKSLIRKNQLHPDISDLVGQYGSGFFITPGDLDSFQFIPELTDDNVVYTTGNQDISGLKNFVTRLTVNGTGVLLSGEAAQVDLSSTVRTTGNQTISGSKNFTTRPTLSGLNLITTGDLVDLELQILGLENIVFTSGNQTLSGLKNFISRPTVNGTGVLLQGEASTSQEFKFTGDLAVTLANGKTFGKYQNGQTIPASGKTTSEVIKLAIVEAINPTVNLSVSPTAILLGQTNVLNLLTFGFTLNNPGATLASDLLQRKRGNDVNWITLATNPDAPEYLNNPASPFFNADTNTVGNSNAYNYRYVVTDSEGSTATATANVSFLHGNYFGYNAATSLTTIAQIEALGNQVLSDSRARTINGVTAGAGLYTYYAYRAGAGDLTSIIQDGAAPVLGAFTKQNDIVGTNLNGASVTYRVYKSNATQAFTNNNLAFS